MNYSLEFTYDGDYTREITATEDCDVVYHLRGGGGGGGGYDSPYQGSPGVISGRVTGIISLMAGEKLYCAIGEAGKRGTAGSSAAGGLGGRAIVGYAGGRGGNSGPYGWSGSGGGGGGATVLWKMNGFSQQILAVAAGGGGGGGGGHYSAGYIRQIEPWGYTTGNRGGTGENHPGDGGGPGGGGGGSQYYENFAYLSKGFLPFGGGTSRWGSTVLRNYHVWHPSGGVWTTLYVNFPESTNYTFRTASDDIGTLYIGGNSYDISGYNNDKNISIFVNAGWQEITIYAENTGGGPYGYAVRIFRQRDNLEVWNTRQPYTAKETLKYNGGGQGGIAPGGDSGAMSGSTGYSYISNPYLSEYSVSSSYSSYGNGGAAFANGMNGYAGFSAIKRNVSTRSSSWLQVNRIYVRQGAQWLEPNEVNVYSNGAWKKVYGLSLPSYTSYISSFDNISGPRV